MQALCMSCRETVDGKSKPTMQEMKNPAVTEKNGRYSAKGKCGTCDGNMFKFMSKADAEKMM